MAARSKTLDLGYSEPRTRLIGELRQQMGRWEASVSARDDTFSTGTPALDQLLAGNRLRYGMLTEWLSGMARCGAATLSLLCAREACRQGGTLVVIDRRQTFYPPAAAAWGIDLNRLIIVRPQSVRDELWAAVQSLRSPAVAAVWAPIDRLDSRAFRQLQLAAQAGRTLGLLLRPAHVRGRPSWADVQLWISGEHGAGSREYGTPSKKLLRAPCSSLHASLRRVQVRILRTRNGRPGGSVILEIDDAAHTLREVKENQQPNHDSLPLPVVPKLADSMAAPLSARA